MGSTPRVVLRERLVSFASAHRELFTSPAVYLQPSVSPQKRHGMHLTNAVPESRNSLPSTTDANTSLPSSVQGLTPAKTPMSNQLFSAKSFIFFTSRIRC